jgi:hypothetical protein
VNSKQLFEAVKHQTSAAVVCKPDAASTQLYSTQDKQQKGDANLTENSTGSRTAL